jgi:hypothetical protein
MNYLANIKRNNLLMAGMLWLGLVTLAYGASLEELKSRLDLARENLRISEASEVHIASELEKLNNSENISPELIKNYEVYLGRAQEMVAENRRIVKEMAAAYAGHAPSRQPSGSTPSPEAGRELDTEIPEKEELDEMAYLERKFGDSLASFDEMLLKKWDEILARSTEKMKDLSEEMAAAGQQAGQKDEEADTSSAETSAEVQEGTEDSKEGEIPPEEGLDAKNTTAEGQESAPSGEGKGQTSTQKKRSYSSGGDDDIVARQIREAAEKETDPELKEKLWKEYEEYKKGSSQ